MRNIPGTEYIQKDSSCGRYHVVYQRTYKGHFKTLIGALMIRDWCQANNWEVYPYQDTISKQKYIHKFKDVWGVGKRVNGKMKYYGFFKELSDAIEYRDYIVHKGWSSNHMYNKVFSNPLKYIRKTTHGYMVNAYINQKMTYFGTYNTLENAIEVRDLAIKYDGDWDLMCEGFEYDSVEWLNNKSFSKNFFEKVDRGAADLYWAFHKGLLKPEYRE